MMENKAFKALIVKKKEGKYIRTVGTQTLDQLPAGEVLIRVKYSSLNYKDALSATGAKGITKDYPHIPGIDAAGIVEACSSDKFKVGDQVVVTGYDFGMNTSGGFGQYVRVPDEWPILLPEGLTLKESMMFGTAGLTAGMSVLKLSDQVKPADGNIAVSGATGGVGSLSVAILSKLGYHVVAISGKKQEDYLKKIGAKEVLDRTIFGEKNPRPFLKSIFAGGIDAVGGSVLDNLIKSTKELGVVTCCGNAASPNLDLTVFPFILKGVSLIGIDSQKCPKPIREKVWNKLATDWKVTMLDEVCEEQSLEELNASIDLMMAGNLKGRVLVNLDK